MANLMISKCIFTGIHLYEEADSIHSVKSSLKSHPALVALYKKYNFLRVNAITFCKTGLIENGVN